MKPSRHDIVDLLERQADTAAPGVDPVFVAQLERRLRSIDLSIGAPRRRRVGRVWLTAIIAATATAGVAAAAGVISLRSSPDTPSATTAAVTTVVSEPVATSLVTAAVETPSSVDAPTTLPGITSTAVVTTIPATAPPSTAAPTTEVTPSTEVRVPATLTLACTPVAAAIECSWDAGPDGTTHYAVLRTEPGVSPGRVFTPEPGATSYIDTLVVPGTTYTYLVHALDETEHSLAHSDPSSAPCCG